MSGHVVEAAYNGPEGLAVARGFRPDLVLLDIALPGMDGYEVLTRLREEPATRRARIIAVTGYGHEDERRRALDAGFDGHLPKPIDQAMLTSILRDIGEHRDTDVARASRCRSPILTVCAESPD